MLTFGLSAQVNLLTPKAQRKSCIAQVKSNTDNLKSFKKKKNYVISNISTLSFAI